MNTSVTEKMGLAGDGSQDAGLDRRDELRSPAGPSAVLDRMPGTDRLEDSPLWPVRIAFDPQSWAQAPVEELRVGSLHRTQRRVCKKYLGGRGNDRAGVGKDRPWVVRAHGRNWLVDGHHRVVDEAMAGKPTITAYVRTLPET